MVCRRLTGDRLRLILGEQAEELRRYQEGVDLDPGPDLVEDVGLVLEPLVDLLATFEINDQHSSGHLTGAVEDAATEQERTVLHHLLAVGHVGGPDLHPSFECSRLGAVICDHYVKHRRCPLPASEDMAWSVVG